MQMKELQKEILENKRRHNFPIGDIQHEFLRFYMELGEAYDAYCEGLDSFGEELADSTIFLMGIAEMRDINLEAVILKRQSENVENNESDIYKLFGNVNSKAARACDAYYKCTKDFDEKLADVVISLMEIAESREIDLWNECVKKVEKNKNRIYKRNELGHMVHI